MSEFYTRNGWEGKRYKEAKDLPLKEIAKRIKQEIRQKHPDITVSVRTEHFANGCAINVTIKDCPFNPINPEWNNRDTQINRIYTEQARALLKDIEHIGNQYKRSDSDGMIDYFNESFYYSVNFDWELKHNAMEKIREVEV